MHGFKCIFQCEASCLLISEKPCGFPSVENGRIAQYYYTFESYYFPMSINQNLSFSCLAGFTTATGKREARTTCTAAGWSPEPRCFGKWAVGPGSCDNSQTGWPVNLGAPEGRRLNLSVGGDETIGPRPFLQNESIF